MNIFYYYKIIFVNLRLVLSWVMDYIKTHKTKFSAVFFVLKYKKRKYVLIKIGIWYNIFRGLYISNLNSWVVSAIFLYI